MQRTSGRCLVLCSDSCACKLHTGRWHVPRGRGGIFPHPHCVGVAYPCAVLICRDTSAKHTNRHPKGYQILSNGAMPQVLLRPKRLPTTPTLVPPPAAVKALRPRYKNGRKTKVLHRSHGVAQQLVRDTALHTSEYASDRELMKIKAKAGSGWSAKQCPMSPIVYHWQ